MCPLFYTLFRRSPALPSLLMNNLSARNMIVGWGQCQRDTAGAEQQPLYDGHLHYYFYFDIKDTQSPLKVIMDIFVAKWCSWGKYTVTYYVVNDEHSFSFYVHSHVVTASFNKKKQNQNSRTSWGYQFSKGGIQLTNNSTKPCFHFKCSFKGKCVYLPMDVDYGAQETPRPTLPVHMEHSQDLQEANPSGKYQCLKADAVCACRQVCKLCEWVFGLQQFLWESILGLQVFLFPFSWRNIWAALVSPGSHWAELISDLYIDHCTSCFQTSCHIGFILFILWDYVLCTFLKL